AFHLKKAIQLDSTNAESYIHLGQVYYSIRRLEEGEAVLNQALKLSSQLPTSTKAWAYQSKGWTYLLWGKYDQAISSFKQSIALDGRNPWTYKGLGDVYVGLDDLQKAEWYYLKAREVNDQYPITHLWVGDICKRLNRYADAEWSYLRALEVFPDHKQALHDLINLYQETGQQELAQKWQQKLVALSPDDPLVHIQHGQLAYVNKQFDAAEKHFKKAMILSKGELWVPSDIGSFYYKHSEDSLAESYMKHILTKDSTYWSPYYYLPNILNAGGRKSEAISLANSGLARATTTLDQLRIVAGLCNNIIYHSGDMDAYLEYTRQAEAAHPSTKGAALLAQNLKENNFEGAAAILAQLLKIYPTDGPGNYINCHIKIKLGKFEEAVEALDKALGTTQISFQQVQNDPKLNPIQQRHRFQQLMRKHFPEKYDDLDTFEFIQEKPIYYPENCVAMANYYNRRGEPERAKFMYEKAVELKPDPPTQELAMMLAEVYLKQGKYEEAKAICPDELEPDDVEEHLSIGQLYYQLGRPDKAEAHFTAYVQKGSRSNRAQQVAWFYHQHGECDLAGQYLRKAVLIQPGSYRPFYDLGWLYFSCGDTKKAILLMDEGIRAFPAEFDLKGIKAMILALSDPSDQPGKAFAALETEQPDMAQIGTCLDLMRAKKYEEATAAYQTITKGIDDWWVRRMLRFAYVRMLVAKGDLDAAMDEIDKGDTWIFSYPLLYGDDTLAPLRGTERFRAFVQRKFPEKAR
ncbi:MAG: tetratricopeptide repeat protein, partial [Bacteroidetes bacterium]